MYEKTWCLLLKHKIVLRDQPEFGLLSIGVDLSEQKPAFKFRK